MSENCCCIFLSCFLVSYTFTIPARAGIYTATILGLTTGQLGVLFTPWGPLLPFLTGSTVGFGLGVWNNWSRLLDRTRQYARHYPHILAHALWVEQRIRVPRSALVATTTTTTSAAAAKPKAPHDDDVETPNPMVEWVTTQGLGHLSMCAMAAQSCQVDVEEVDRQERQRIMDATVAQMAGHNSNNDDADHENNDE